MLLNYNRSKLAYCVPISALNCPFSRYYITNVLKVEKAELKNNIEKKVELVKKKVEKVEFEKVKSEKLEKKDVNEKDVLEDILDKTLDIRDEDQIFERFKKEKENKKKENSKKEGEESNIPEENETTEKGEEYNIPKDETNYPTEDPIVEPLEISKPGVEPLEISKPGVEPFEISKPGVEGDGSPTSHMDNLLDYLTRLRLALAWQAKRKLVY